ncbi:MAG TPA: helix-turn-helix transcriptional regulator [Verrucomicrobiae bacterium]|nr:helix-turn-helix transcriptional regulator [Verrucomicrobiae bacterium]
MKQRNFIHRLVARKRNQKGWTQDEFADRLQFAGWHDATRSTVSKIEDGSLRIDLEQIYYISAALGIQQPMQFLSEIDWSRCIQMIRANDNFILPKFATDNQERMYGNR